MINSLKWLTEQTADYAAKIRRGAELNAEGLLSKTQHELIRVRCLKHDPHQQHAACQQHVQTRPEQASPPFLGYMGDK